jgi:glycosyltransferase involved in cell wall biosynthesis
MKIALVAQHATPVPNAAADQAGDDTRVRELGRSLASKGHHVTVYAQRTDHALPDHAELHPGVRVEYIGSATTGRDEAELLARVPDFAAALRDRLDRERPDVVHALSWTSGLAALAATRDLPVPVVQSFGSLGVAERRHHLIPEIASTKRIRLESAIGRSVTAVLAGSSDEESDLADMGVPRRSITVVPFGVDTDEFAPEGPTAKRGDRLRLVTVTDLDAHDELATLLQALSKVPGAELVIAGGPPRAELADDPAHRKLASLAGALGVADRVLVTGQVNRAALPPLLRSADLFVSTAEYDPTGMVSLEAMACGTPVVATAGGGQVDAIVDGTTGILVPPRRPTLLAQRIRQLLSHPMLLEAFSVAAADRACSRYSWDRIAHETLAVYDSVRDAALLAA